MDDFGLDEFCEEARKKIAQADLLKAFGLKSTADIVLFGHLMLQAGFIEATHIALSTVEEMGQGKLGATG